MRYGEISAMVLLVVIFSLVGISHAENEKSLLKSIVNADSLHKINEVDGDYINTSVIELYPCISPKRQEIQIKETKKKKVSVRSSEHRIHYPNLRKRSPMITVDYGPGLPLFNVIPVSEIGVIMEDFGPWERSSISDLIRTVAKPANCDLSKESLQFELWSRGKIVRIVDATIPIFDEIEKRRIQREAALKTEKIGNHHLKK